MKNFATAEVRILDATTTSASGEFTSNTINDDCMIVNDGTVGAWVKFSPTSSPTAVNEAGGADGTSQTYVAAGSTFVVRRSSQRYFAAITDSGTTKLILHTGSGT